MKSHLYIFCFYICIQKFYYCKNYNIHKQNYMWVAVFTIDNIQHCALVIWRWLLWLSGLTSKFFFWKHILLFHCLITLHQSKTSWFIILWKMFFVVVMYLIYFKRFNYDGTILGTLLITYLCLEFLYWCDNSVKNFLALSYLSWFSCENPW